MATLTKLELTQRLDAALKDNEALRLQLAEAQGTITALRAKLPAPKPARQAWVDPHAELRVEYRAYLGRVREAAMRGERPEPAVSFAVFKAEREDAHAE